MTNSVKITTCRTDELIQRGILEIGDGYRAKNSELGDAGLPFARAANINNGFLFNDADRFPASNRAKAGTKISRPGDVVFTSKGTVGRFAFVGRAIEEFVYSPQLCFWRSLDHRILNPRYLYYWMQSRECLDQIDYLKGQTDMADYVSLRDQRRMTISFPEPETQLEAAGILGSLDDRITLLRETNATLEAIAQALFKSWFVDFDPVRAKAEGQEPVGLPPEVVDLFPDELVESKLGISPKGWEIAGLDTIAKFLNGLALQKFPPEDDDNYLPVIKIAQLRKGDVIGADQASINIKPEYIVADGDILFSWSGSLEAVIWCGGPGALNQHLFKVTSANFPKWFYFSWIRHHLPQFREIAAHKATTMGHIQRHHLTEAKVVVPQPGLITALSEIMEPLMERQIQNLLQIKSLAQLRDTLLPRLMSGKLRIAEAEKELEAV